jgi:hypothetical protein
LTTTKQYDFLDRLQQATATPAGANQVPVGCAYQYDSANQRTRRTEADGSNGVSQ